MNISAPFIKRPVGTSLLTIALALAGCLGYWLLPVSPLPQVDFPTIQVSANLPGASPETMASAVATPLERQFSRIAGVTEITSTNNLGATSVTLQFELNRDINGAARDVQAAINAARSQLPANLPSNPSYRKVNPADAPIMLLSLTSDTIEIRKLYDLAYSVLQQKVSQVEGVGQVIVGGSSLPAVRVELIPQAVSKYGVGLEQVRTALGAANANRPKGQLSDAAGAWEIQASDQLLKAEQYRALIVAAHNGAVVRLSDLGEVTDSVENLRAGGSANGKPAILMIIFRQPGANIIETVDSVRALVPQLQASISPAAKLAVLNDRTTTIRASVRDVELTLALSVALVILIAGRATDRLHRAFDERVAGGGLHPDPADGRGRRPPVPRIRGDAFGRHRRLARRIANGDADDVREVFAARERDRSWPFLSRGRARLQSDSSPLRQRAEVDARPSATDAAGDDPDDLRQRLPLHHRPQRLLPRSGHRTFDGKRSGRAGHFVSGDAAETVAGGRDHPGRSGRGHRGRVHGWRRLDDKHGANVCLPEAAR
jgi:hypothetical protein